MGITNKHGINKISMYLRMSQIRSQDCNQITFTDYENLGITFNSKPTDEQGMGLRRINAMNCLNNLEILEKKELTVPLKSYRKVTLLKETKHEE